MGINADLQKLQPGSKIRLYEVDGTKFGLDVLRFHNEGIAFTEAELRAANGDESKLPEKAIWWQGEKYTPWGVAIEGLEVSSEGASAQPKLTVSNTDGSISALCNFYKDMRQAKVTVHDTFVHYLDAKNFPGGNPTADPDEEKKHVYFIDRKSNEDDEAVEFELASPADLRGVKIPTRQIHSMCTWCSRGWYRTGKGCDYAGTNYFDERGNPVDDPSRDKCGGLVSDCKKRFGENEELSFGGFPGSSLIRG